MQLWGRANETCQHASCGQSNTGGRTDAAAGNTQATCDGLSARCSDRRYVYDSQHRRGPANIHRRFVQHTSFLRGLTPQWPRQWFPGSQCYKSPSAYVTRATAIVGSNLRGALQAENSQRRTSVLDVNFGKHNFDAKYPQFNLY